MGRKSIERMADNPGMERNRILDGLAEVGCLFEETKEDVEKVLTHVQCYMTLERIAGRGGSRVTILGTMKEPEQRHFSSLLGWTARKQLALKLKYPKLDMSTVYLAGDSQMVFSKGNAQL